MRAGAAAPGDAGSLLAGLRLGTDRAFVERLRSRVAAHPPKPLRILLVTHAAMKHQEKAVLSFFGHAPLAGCDAWTAGGRERSLRPAVPGLRYVTGAEARARRYDRVIGFDANGAFVEQCARHGCPGAFVGKPRERLSAAAREAAAALAAPVRTYGTHASLPEDLGFDACFGHRRWRPGGSIDFPPNLDLHLAIPAEPRIVCVLLGGGDRDYAFVLAHADRLPAPIVVTQADLSAVTVEADRDALVAMRSDPRFTLLSWLPPLAYARLLLHARVVLFPARGDAAGDYTSIADAVWYGRPVLTNPVPPNAHMGDRVVFYEGPGELEARFRELEDPDRWRAASARALEGARRKNDLFALLERVYRDL
jgi:hypothetical protein